MLPLSHSRLRLCAPAARRKANCACQNARLRARALYALLIQQYAVNSVCIRRCSCSASVSDRIGCSSLAWFAHARTPHHSNSFTTHMHPIPSKPTYILIKVCIKVLLISDLKNASAATHYQLPGIEFALDAFQHSSIQQH